MIRLGVGISRGTDILEIPLRQGRLVFRQGRRPCQRRSGSASAQKKRTGGGTEKRKIFPVTQSKKLLTVIHNPTSGFFSPIAALEQLNARPTSFARNCRKE